MLEKQDIQAIASLILESEQRTSQEILDLEKQINQNFLDLEKQINQKFFHIEKCTLQKIKKTEFFLLDEISRVYVSLDKQIGNIQRKINYIEEFYRITKLNEDNSALLLKLHTSLEKRISALENHMT